MMSHGEKMESFHASSVKPFRRMEEIVHGILKELVEIYQVMKNHILTIKKLLKFV